MNNKGFELSTSFLVGLILGIVLFGLGMVFIFRVFNGVGAIEAVGLPSYIEAEAQNCVQRNDLVCLPKAKDETETTKASSFGVVINNIYGSSRKFKIYVEFRGGLTEDNEEISYVDIADWTFTDFNELVLENNKHDIIEVPLRPPKGTLPGNYVFNVDVCFNANDNPSNKCSGAYPSLYGSTHQITLTVI